MEHSGCRRWLIFVSGFMAFFFQYGTIKSLGLLISHITADLRVGAAFIGLCIGLVSGVSLCLSIITIPLSRRYPTRSLIMLGGAISGLAIISASICPNGSLFGLALFIAGIGNALYTSIVMYLPTIYFPHQFGLVLSVMLLGCSAGIMILPVITQWFVMIYNWRWALSFLGALNLNTMVLGALIRSQPRRRDRTDGEGSERDPLLMSSWQNHTCASSSSTREEIMMDNLNENICTTDDHEQKSGTCISQRCGSLCGFLAKTFSIAVFTNNPRFIAIFVSQFFCAFSYCCWIVFLIPNAESKGLNADWASLLALVNGGSNACGRICAGLACWRYSPNYFIIFSVLSLITATASLCNVFASTFWQLSVAAGLAGFSGGFKIVISSLLCMAATTEDLFSSGLAWALFIFGVGEPLGDVIMGALYDHTSSYGPGFLFVCMADFLSAFVIISPILIKSCKGI